LPQIAQIFTDSLLIYPDFPANIEETKTWYFICQNLCNLWQKQLLAKILP